MARKLTYEELEQRVKELEKEAANSKWAERAVRESEEKFKAITGSAKDAIIMMDNEGYISYWNKAAEKIFGYSAYEALGKELHMFLAPQKYHDAYQQRILTFKSTGHGPIVGKTLELEAERKDGTRFPLELSVSAVKIEKKWYATGIIRDITERKQAQDALIKAHDELEQRVKERTAKLSRTTEQLKLELAERKRVEESLRQSEERFRSVAQTASDAIITVDSRGHIVFWNDAADKIFGYSADEVMGKPLTFIMPERFTKDQRNALEEVFSTAQSGIIGKTVEKVGRRKKGGEFLVELSVARWKTKEGVFFTGIVRDVTDRNRAEEQIRHLSRQLIRVIEEERKGLARDLHDEFGQALTALHFGLGALRNSLPGELKDQKTRCDGLIVLSEQLGDNIRNISSELRPDMLDDLGLIPTLEWCIEDFAKRSEGPRIDFEAAGVKKRPDPEIVVLSMHKKEAYVHQVFASGALAYVLKASPSSDVLEAIRAVHRGEYFLSSKIRAEVIGAYLQNRRGKPVVRGYDLLSEREQQVFRLMVEGNSTNQIADVLCVSPKTVEKHRTNVRKKLGIHDLVAMVKYAIKIGIIDTELWED